MLLSKKARCSDACAHLDEIKGRAVALLSISRSERLRFLKAEIIEGESAIAAAQPLGPPRARRLITLTHEKFRRRA